MPEIAVGMLDPEQLNEADVKIIDVLAADGGRMRPVHIAEKTGLGRSYVSQRVKRLFEHGHVQKPYDGLYELSDDPRE